MRVPVFGGESINRERNSSCNPISSSTRACCFHAFSFTLPPSLSLPGAFSALFFLWFAAPCMLLSFLTLIFYAWVSVRGSICILMPTLFLSLSFFLSIYFCIYTSVSLSSRPLPSSNPSFIHLILSINFFFHPSLLLQGLHFSTPFPHPFFSFHASPYTLRLQLFVIDRHLLVYFLFLNPSVSSPVSLIFHFFHVFKFHSF